MLCLNERGDMHCGYRDVRTNGFGDTCTTGDDCAWRAISGPPGSST
jgi:hypothetical protein